MTKAADIMRILTQKADKKQAERLQSFFKTGKGEYAEGDVFWGIKLPEIKKLAHQYASKLDFEDIEKLLHQPCHEARSFAVCCLVWQYEHLAKEQAEKKQITDFYLNNRHLINNWDLVDISAHKILGDYVAQTQDNGILYALADEDNLWAQRIAVVSCWCLIKQDNFADIKNLAVKFLGHKHDLIHKSVGWMLREMGKRNEKELLAFLDSYAASLPRTTLRYALERLPEEVRHYYMRKKQ